MSDNNTFRVTCPYCGQTNEYYTWDRRDDGLIHCSNCGSLVDTSRASTATPRATQPSDFSRDSTSSSGYAPAPQSDPWAASKAKSGGNQWLLCCAILSILFLPIIIGVPLGICLGIVWYQGRPKEDATRPRTPQTW